MIDLDRTSLDRILPAASGPADWDDVLGRSGVQQRRRRLVVAFAVAAAVAALAATAVGAVRVLFLDKGFIGLPPEGATPSAPTRGQLVLHYRVESPRGANPRRSAAWVYADGRVIWLRETDSRRARLRDAATRFSTGFLEQRLTSRGVGLLRSEIVKNVVFGHQEPPTGYERIPFPFPVGIAVRRGSRLVPATSARGLRRLETRLWNPASWLPASAWVQRRTSGYVASRYQICYGGLPVPLEPSRMLSLFPPAAAEVLRAKATTRRDGRRGYAGGPLIKSVDYCSASTTQEARGIAEALSRAGGGKRNAVQLNFRVDVPGSKIVDPTRPDHAPVRRTIYITFEPYLPHGEAVCSTCG